jgi:Rod binding domain-containing protein
MISMASAAASIAGASGTTQDVPQPRLVKAAHEFEAQMMKELLKPMMSASGVDGEDGDAVSGSSSALSEFATEALGEGLSQAGGLGLANSIIHQLSSAGNKKVTSRVTPNRHGDTVIKTSK